MHENASARRAELKKQLKEVEDKLGVWETNLVNKLAVSNAKEGIAKYHTIRLVKNQRRGYVVEPKEFVTVKIQHKKEEE